MHHRVLYIKGDIGKKKNACTHKEMSHGSLLGQEKPGYPLIPALFFSQTRRRAVYHYIKKKNGGLKTPYNTTHTPTHFTRHNPSLYRQRPDP